MRANWAAPSIERVSAVSGAAITTTSDRSRRSISPARGSHSSGRTPVGITRAGGAIALVDPAGRIARQGDDAHPERRLGHAGQLAPDAAIADDAEGGAPNLRRNEQGPPLGIGRPAAPALPLDHARHAMAEGQERGDRVLGDGGRVHAARRGQRHGALGIDRMIDEPIDARQMELHPLELGRPLQVARRGPRVQDLRARVVGLPRVFAADGQARRHRAQAGELAVVEPHRHEHVDHGAQRSTSPRPPQSAGAGRP